MTVTLALEKRLRRHTAGPVDYDASHHVATAAATVLRYTPRSRTGTAALTLLVHWGYGSAVAGVYPALRERFGGPRAAFAVYLGCQAMAMTLFPTLGGTPPPWLWRRDVLASALAQHAVYATTVYATDRTTTRLLDARPLSAA